MQWTTDVSGDIHTLEDRGSRLAFIALRQTQGLIQRWRVKTAVAFLYFGAARQRRLERAHKQWVVTTRRFRERADAEAHLARKRADVERFIKARESAK